MYPQEQRLKGVIYIAKCSGCRTYNLSGCHLPVEIWVCLSSERNENDDTKGQNSAFIYYVINNFINMKYLLNAFSLQMVDVPCNVTFTEVKELPRGLVSAVGHQDTAKFLGVECNRINVHLNEGDIAYVAQLQGGRLPEGSTTLPEGFSFKYIKVEVL